MRTCGNSDFCRLAPHYLKLEELVFGSALQDARVAHLEGCSPDSKFLLLGEGGGRFLESLCALHPKVMATVCDSSPSMLSLINKRLPKENSENIHLLNLDVMETEFPEAAFDVLVTHFFLDCFDPETLDRLIPKLSHFLKDGGSWLIADFEESRKKSYKCRLQRLFLRCLYLFFRTTCNISADRIVPSGILLRQSGMIETERTSYCHGLIYSRLWKKPSS